MGGTVTGEARVKKHLYDSLGAKGIDLHIEPHNKADVSTTKRRSPFCIAQGNALDKGIRHETSCTTGVQSKQGFGGAWLSKTADVHSTVEARIQ